MFQSLGSLTASCKMVFVMSLYLDCIMPSPNFKKNLPPHQKQFPCPLRTVDIAHGATEHVQQLWFYDKVLRFNPCHAFKTSHSLTLHTHSKHKPLQHTTTKTKELPCVYEKRGQFSDYCIEPVVYMDGQHSYNLV